MLLPIMMMFQDTTSIAAIYAEYREKTRVEVRCTRPKDENEITVCARRQADRYQTPFIAARGASNANGQENILLNREAQGHVECGKDAFLVRCGSVGVGVSVSSGGGVRYKLREPAP